VTRESITYHAVKAVQPNTFLAPDPAFFMEPQVCAMDERLKTGNVIGINISPMIISAEKSAGMAYENYRNLIAHILENTDAYIALIPHVVWATNDDRKVLRRLYEDFDCDPRLILVEDHTAPELKYIISHCRMFIGARTHATIAAYSSAVPTLVVGYSVKARGIARDLFGTEENYVLPVQSLTRDMQLTEAFAWIARQEDQLREHLRQILPDYCAASRNAVNAINHLE
jgi:polysaccharide pyruvyl transferase WcaK-like protein